jgi:mono/diheme cytochrome c family protein
MAGWGDVLVPEEISAMVTLIQRWDEVPSGAIPAPDVPIPTTEESLALGSQLFSTNCSRCHGPEGQGKPIAPALNVKSFLTDTSDQAMQQIITLGVPGTAMPAWGDRMSEAEIQAIVGFIRQWEPTAPEVAQPLGRGGRGGGGQGGPPWLRDTSGTTGAGTGGTAGTAEPAGQVPAVTPGAPASSDHGPGLGAGSGQGQGSAGPMDQEAQANPPAGLDWRVLGLIAAALALAFTLIAMGFSALKRMGKSPPPT